MKKTLLSLLVTIALLAVAFVPALAEESPYPETVSIFTGMNENISKLGLTSYNETEYWKELERRTGTHVEFIHSVAGTDYMTQVNLLVVSNQLPDIINGINWQKVAGGAASWEEDGVIIDLTDLIPECMPNYYAGVLTQPYAIQDLSIDGKMYYISDIQHGMPYAGFTVRGDWLANAGIEPPTTIPEVYDMLVYFKENDMNGNGDPNDEWGMSGLGSRSLNWSPLNLMWAWGVHWDYQLLDGKVVYGPMLPEFAEAIGFVNQLYAEGLLDPDYATQDLTALSGKLMSGLYGLEFGIQRGGTLNNMNPEAREDMFKLSGLPNIKLTEDSPSYVFDTMYISKLNGVRAALTTACKEPEKVLRWLDYLYTDEGTLLFNWGIEHMSFEFDENGLPYADYAGALELYPDYESSISFLYSILGTGAFPSRHDFNRYASTLHPFSALTVEQWGSDFDTSRLLPTLSLSASEMEAINDKLVDIDTYVGIQLDKLINGQVSLDEIPAIQERIVSMGLQDILDVYQAAYDRYLEG